MATIVSGSSTAGTANVDTNYNLNVVTPTTEIQSGFAAATSEVDSGSQTGSRRMKALEASEDFRMRVGLDTPVFSDVFIGSAINSTLWQSPVTTMTVTVGSGFLNLNAGLSVASSAVARVQSYPLVPVIPSFGAYFECVAQFAQTPVASNVSEWGLFFSTGTATPTDGCFFRYTSGGTFQAVVNISGSEPTPVTISSSLATANTSRHYIIQLTEDNCIFWIDDVIVATIARGTAAIGVQQSNALPLAFRTYNSGATGSAQSMKVAWVAASTVDANIGVPYAELMATLGATAAQGQTGQTLGSTANYANSANPTAAVPTNTTAALGSGLGGQFWETDTLAVTTDGIISSYQNPAGTASAPGRVLILTSVSVTSFVQTALTGGAYIAQWSLAFGHNVVSLATAESSGSSTKAPRRVPIGLNYIPTVAALTEAPKTFTMNFPSGLPVYPGEFVQTVKKKIGTAPSAGVIGHIITFDGYWRF